MVELNNSVAEKRNCRQDYRLTIRNSIRLIIDLEAPSAWPVSPVKSISIIKDDG